MTDYAKIRDLLMQGVYKEIVALGAAAVPALIAALKDENKWVRESATRALGKIGDKSAVPALIDALKNEEDAGRGVAAWALGKIGDKSAMPALIAALKDEYADVRGIAAWALGKIAEKSGLDLRAVEKALKEYVESVEKKGNAAEINEAKKEARSSYLDICAAARKHAAEKHLLAGDGVILEGERPKPPAGRNGMYRQVERRAFA